MSMDCLHYDTARQITDSVGISSNIMDWQFSHLSRFSANGISCCSGNAEMKILQRSLQAHYILALLHQTPARQIASPTDHLRVWPKGEPARRPYMY